VARAVAVAVAIAPLVVLAPLRKATLAEMQPLEILLILTPVAAVVGLALWVETVLQLQHQTALGATAVPVYQIQ
jgi:hypothetical protein